MSTTSLTIPNHDAPLPLKYDQARALLADCDEVDEVLDIADKAAALATYARQAQDTELEAMAQRIRLRAHQRMGELLRSSKVHPGGRPSKTTGTVPPVSAPPTRKAIAAAVGTSEQTLKDAVAIANIPGDEFEQVVEQPKPPSVRKLARQGKGKGKPRKPPPPPDSPGAHTLKIVKFSTYLDDVDFDALVTHVKAMEIDDRKHFRKCCKNIGDFFGDVRAAIRPPKPKEPEPQSAEYDSDNP